MLILKLFQIRLKIYGLDVKSHLSSITEDESKKIEKLIKGVSKTKSMENKKEKNDEPVIIRRAVIINDEEEKKEEKRKKEQARKKDVGFIENKRKKDYNIVYRDKPTKPLTVSELLGIAKKEPEKKVEEKVVVKSESEKTVSKPEKEVVVEKEEKKVAEVKEVKEEPKKAEPVINNAQKNVKKANDNRPRYENRDNN